MVPFFNQHQGLKAVALWTAFKASAVLLVGIGFACLVAHGESAHDMAQWLVGHLHMEADGQVATLFLEWSDHVSLQGWFVFFGVIAAYCTIHGVQAFGLWREYRWAEWMTALSAAIYMPLEIWGMARHFSWLPVVLFVVNLSVVCYMGWMLWTGRRKHGGLA